MWVEIWRIAVPTHQTCILPEQMFVGSMGEKHKPFALLEGSAPSEWF